MTITDHLANEAALADQLRAERLCSAGLEERIAELERELEARNEEIENLNGYITRADVPSLRARIASLEATIAGLSAGFASKMATALEAIETRTAQRIAEWMTGPIPGELINEGNRHLVGLARHVCESVAGHIQSGAWRHVAATTCSDLVAFADGELPADRATAFREHLRTCGTCATALPETMMVAARLSELKR